MIEHHRLRLWYLYIGLWNVWRIGKIDVDRFMPSGMENFKKVFKLVSEGNQLEDRVRQHFKAQYKDTKASAYDLQSQYYRTELAICQESLNREYQSLGKDSESQKN